MPMSSISTIFCFSFKNFSTYFTILDFSSFPNTISGVVYQSGAFDAVRDGQINLTPDSTARKAAQDALNGWDPSYGAIYYFNPATATNKWIWSRPMTITIGKHRFCK